MKLDMESAKNDLQSDSAVIQERGVRTVEALAERGDALAIYAQATWYLYGAHGYEKNTIKAKALLELSAGKLIPEAVYDLAVLLENNEDLKRRKREAFSLYVVSAILGDKDSIRELSRCFYWGIGTFKNRATSDLLNKILNDE